MRKNHKASLIKPLLIILMSVPILASELDIVVGEANTEKFPEICFTISVKDSAGEKIEDLDTSMVKVFEDSVQNNELIIQTLGESENQVAILIAVDASGSMAGEPIDSIKSAIKSFADQLSENDQVGILAFHDEVEVICPFTTNMATVKTLADSIKAGGDTELYEGVYKGLDYLYEDIIETSDNVIGRFLNSLRSKELFNIVSSNYTMGNDGQVKITLRLAARGTTAAMMIPAVIPSKLIAIQMTK